MVGVREHLRENGMRNDLILPMQSPVEHHDSGVIDIFQVFLKIKRDFLCQSRIQFQMFPLGRMILFQYPDGKFATMCIHDPEHSVGKPFRMPSVPGFGRSESFSYITSFDFFEYCVERLSGRQRSLGEFIRKKFFFQTNEIIGHASYFRRIDEHSGHDENRTSKACGLKIWRSEASRLINIADFHCDDGSYYDKERPFGRSSRCVARPDSIIDPAMVLVF